MVSKMKYWTICLILVCPFLLTACGMGKDYYMFTSFHEPADEGLRFLYSKNGVDWDSVPGVWLRPEVGKQRIMRDPSIARTPDGVFHLVWTSSWKGDKGFGYASSKDLVHWSEERMIPVMEDEPATINVWAPEIFYDEDNKRCIIVWASCIPGRFEKGIEAEDNNHRLYYTITRDFKTFSKAKLLYDPGFSSIDAVILKRKRNDYVMVLKDNTRPERNLKIAFAKSALGPYTPASKPFTDSFIEGPAVAKVGKDYLIYFDVYRKKIFGAMRTRDFVHFIDETSRVHLPRGHKHGTIFKAPRKIVDNLLDGKR